MVRREDTQMWQKDGEEKRPGRQPSGNGDRPPRRSPQPGEEDKGRRWRRPSRTQAFWIFFILVLIFAAKFFGSMPSDERVVSYKEYRDYLKELTE